MDNKDRKDGNKQDTSKKIGVASKDRSSSHNQCHFSSYEKARGEEVDVKDNFDLVSTFEDVNKRPTSNYIKRAKILLFLSLESLIIAIWISFSINAKPYMVQIGKKATRLLQISFKY